MATSGRFCFLAIWGEQTAVTNLQSRCHTRHFQEPTTKGTACVALFHHERVQRNSIFPFRQPALTAARQKAYLPRPQALSHRAFARRTNTPNTSDLTRLKSKKIVLTFLVEQNVVRLYVPATITRPMINTSSWRMWVSERVVLVGSLSGVWANGFLYVISATCSHFGAARLKKAPRTQQITRVCLCEAEQSILTRLNIPKLIEISAALCVADALSSNANLSHEHKQN